MGHQVNFYLDPRDTEQIESVLRSLGPMLVLHSRSPRPEPKLLDHLTHEEQGQPWLFYHLVRPEHLGAVVLGHVPAQGYWTVDVLNSPVIEFTRCFFDGTILRRGRLSSLGQSCSREDKEDPEEVQDGLHRAGS